MVALVVLVALLAACGDDDGESGPPSGAAEEEPVSEGSEDDGDDEGAGEGAGEDETEEPSAPPSDEARATVEIHGEVHQLTLVDGATNAQTLECDIDADAQDATVAGMVSPDGYEVQMFPSFGWAASVIEPDGTAWMAGAADSNPDADYSVEFSEGRLVVDGTWGDASESTTTDIRMEVVCP